MGNKEQDISQRLTEMLDDQQGGQGRSQAPEVVRDNTPPPAKSLQQLEGELISDYQQVQAGKTDKEFVTDLAAKFMAVANDRELRNLVSFDALRAADTLYELASGQRRAETIEYYRIVRYK